MDTNTSIRSVNSLFRISFILWQGCQTPGPDASRAAHAHARFTEGGKSHSTSRDTAVIT